MIAKIVPIGNSKGVRIPNHILKELNIENKVEMIFDENHKEIRLKPIRKIREGWDDSFKNMKKNNDDQLIIDDSIDLPDLDW